MGKKWKKGCLILYLTLLPVLSLLGAGRVQSAELKLSPQTIEVFPDTDFFVDILANSAGADIVVAEVRFRLR